MLTLMCKPLAVVATAGCLLALFIVYASAGKPTVFFVSSRISSATSNVVTRRDEMIPSHRLSHSNQDVGGSEGLGVLDERAEYFNEMLSSGKDSFQNRRSFLLSSSLGTSSLVGVPLSASAAKGAAEYDLEYYLRDIIMGNRPEGNLPASNGPPLPPPRALQGALLSLLLDDELQNCITIQELSRITKIPIATLSEQIRSFRSKVQPAFGSRYPWKEEVVSDEYYFDLTCYSLWKIASVSPELAENYAKREEFVRNIGRQILNAIMERGMISKESTATLSKGGHKHSGITVTETIPAVVEILDLFQSTKYCSAYRLGDKNDEERTGLKVFDALDDEEIISPNGVGSVNCLVSVFNPATLGGALQITGEGSRFAPDFVGPTLAAVWERVGSVDKGSSVFVSFESYFVDPVYRPNPKDFFPDERLYQFTISKKN
mmetsp:Transcript_24160/g.50088  ORF Transcript_24160/g.50088 Transcript_24160/m.50088 type:complete len:432 (-) Transcript_24160:125-1420(-)